ncbi:unnamed protein product [Lactuca virosa]|uniref:Protein kinase domain-containing protein n=1 Tax=Lactuca virosa TaxID=75947 RepID=A0AAU9LKZ0_9ASTR|nr:unnamed protein product [Lactuca virosa]
MALLKQLEHLKISFDVIKLATNNFGPENFIGVGGFGKVYKAEITSTDGLTKTVAIKRLDRRHGQGEHEFLMEIMMLSRYRHKNLVSLLGFCDEGEEKILVYEYEFNGSLEKYLSSTTLTWAQRLKICIGAARGLEYLHNPLGTQQRILHRDVKSANVLLDQFWEAKIADFGLSKMGPANQEYTFLVSNAVGTFGYCDPLYAETNILTKESDVYSFGAVLFEVLCGRLCIGRPDDKHRLLTKLAQQSYEQGTLEDIIFNGLREQMEPNSLKTFSSIAYRCLKREREERPTMAQVLEELELALEYQESFQSGKPMEYEEIIEMADREQSLVYTNKRELKLLLSSGVRVDWGRRWFSLSKNEHNCEMISASEFSFQDPGTVEWIPYSTSRFSEVAKIEGTHNLQIEYKFKDAYESSFSHFADWTDNGWMMIELCQFVSYRKVAKLELLLEGIPSYNIMLLEGIQFLPVEMQAVEEEPVVVVADNSNTNWEQKLPTDYQYIIKSAKDRVPYNITNKEIYMLLSNGILINRGQMLFSLDKDGIKCCMASARAVLEECDEESRRFSQLACLRWISLHESRFEKVAECELGRVLRINCHINFHMVSLNTPYATYLVYKLPDVSQGTLECPVDVRDINRDSPNFSEVGVIYLTSPTIPFIMLTDGDQDSNQRQNKNPLYRPKIDSLPRLRKDGWMEVEISQFKADTPTSLNLAFEFTFNEREQLTGLIIQGFEIRPK